MKTIKQIADEIGVSKQAVHKKIKQEPLSTSLQPFISTVDGTVYIEVDGELLIKSTFAKYNAVQVDAQIDDIIDSTSTKLIAVLEDQIKVLTEQNQDLREQLKQALNHNMEQSNKIVNLAEQLAELNRNNQILLRQEQEKTALLLPESAADKKRHLFWQFWKK